MEEKILETVKSMLGISDLDDAFDNDILVNINAAFSTLYQVGVGEDGHYFVLRGTETWSDVFKETDLIDFIKLYTYMKVRLAFDPPSNASLLQSLKEQINEVEYRILLQADPSDYFNPSDEFSKELTEEEVHEIWKEVMGSVPPGASMKPVSNKELKDMWNKIMGSSSSDDTLSNEEVVEMWNEIMY